MTNQKDISDNKEQVPDYYGHRKRLKERFLLGGGRDMPDYELLELLLMLSIPRKDVKPLAKQLLAKFGSFSAVINAPAAALYEVSGIKESSYIVFNIVREAAVRSSWDSLKNQDAPVINNWDSMLDYCRTAIGYRDVEEFRIIFLDVKLKVIGEEVQQRGTINQVAIHPREVIKAAISNQANSIIMMHNHPSGEVKPSSADISMTQIINNACRAVGIKLLDHIIISRNNYYSFAQNMALA